MKDIYCVVQGDLFLSNLWYGWVFSKLIKWVWIGQYEGIACVSW